jgi:predicted Zn-dependent peptidase
MSSRLFLEVREKRGLAYSVGSYISMLKDTGAVGVHAGVDPRRTEEAIEVILEEWDKLRREEVPAEELEKAKEFVKGRLSLQMEDSFSVAGWFGQQELLSSDVLTVEETLSAIESVSADDILRVAQGLFLEEKLNLAVVGPFKREDDFLKLLKL